MGLNFEYNQAGLRNTDKISPSVSTGPIYGAHIRIQSANQALDGAFNCYRVLVDPANHCPPNRPTPSIKTRAEPIHPVRQAMPSRHVTLTSLLVAIAEVLGRPPPVSPEPSR